MIGPTPGSPAAGMSVKKCFEEPTPFEIARRASPLANEQRPIGGDVPEAALPAFGRMIGIDVSRVDNVRAIEFYSAKVIRPVDTGNEDERLRMHLPDDVRQMQGPPAPVARRDATAIIQIESAIFSDEMKWPEISRQTGMRFIEEIKENGGFVPIAFGEQTP